MSDTPADAAIRPVVETVRTRPAPFAHAVWIDTPSARLARGLKRDGPGARADWERWVAGADRYIEQERPRERADLVVSGV